MIPDDSPQNPLYLGHALHTGIEKDVKTAISEYFGNYNIINDEIINESIKLEYLIPKVKELLQGDGIHELELQDESFHGFIDYLEPVNEEKTVFDMYDFKYSNKIEHYKESQQLHLYKYKFEKLTGYEIRNMYFMFIPKIMIRQKKDEDICQFRQRLFKELQKSEIRVEKIEPDISKVFGYFEQSLIISQTQEFHKNPSDLCKFCEYKNLCERNDRTMMLPSTKRRTVGQTTKRKLWIYGKAFSGKTTLVDSAPNPLNLNTDGNIQFVTMPYVAIKDGYEGRLKVLAWEVFKNTIEELEKGNNEFKTIVVDLLEDTYESCRLYMYDKLGIEHESDDTFRAWDKVRTEFLSTIRRVTNLDYENIILISHEDMSKDITKKSGDKITAIKPNIQDKIANKIAGMVDIVARVVVEDDDSRTLTFKSNEVEFGGGRMKVDTTSIPLSWDAVVKLYDEVNAGKPVLDEKILPEKLTENKPKDEEVHSEDTKSTRKVRKKVEPEKTSEEEINDLVNDVPDSDTGEVEFKESDEPDEICQEDIFAVTDGGTPFVIFKGEHYPEGNWKEISEEEYKNLMSPKEEKTEEVKPTRRTRRVRG